MSCGIVKCCCCGDEVEDAGIIYLSVAGDNNQVQLYICEPCENTGRFPGNTLMETIKALVVGGIKRLTGMKGPT